MIQKELNGEIYPEKTIYQYKLDPEIKQFKIHTKIYDSNEIEMNINKYSIQIGLIYTIDKKRVRYSSKKPADLQKRIKESLMSKRL